MSKFSENVMKKIRDDHISPRARWIYVFMNVLMVVLFFLSVILGGLMVGIILHWGVDVEVFRIGTLPYWWLFGFVVFLVLAFVDFRKTKSGYKYGFMKILLAQVVLTVVFGVGLHFTSVPEDIENYFAENVSFYKGIEEITEEVWNDVDEGMLAGKVVSVSPDGRTIEIIDSDKQSWDMDVSDVVLNLESGKKLPKCAYMKFVGEKTSDSSFTVVEMRCWDKKKVDF